MKALLAGVVLFLITSLSAQAATGFFKGPRAEAIDVLKRANRPEMKSDEALKLVLGARSTYYANGDRYVDYFIDQILSRLYLAAGDPDAAQSHAATALASYSAAMKGDGIAQAMYTFFLFMYDLDLPPAELFGGAENGADQMETQLKELQDTIENAVERLSPEDAAVATRIATNMERAMTDVVEGMAQKDARRLKRGRDDALRLLDEAQRIARTRTEMTAEDEEIVTIERKMFKSLMNLAISLCEHNRRVFERSARDLSTQFNSMIERDQ